MGPQIWFKEKLHDEKISFHPSTQNNINLPSSYTKDATISSSFLTQYQTFHHITWKYITTIGDAFWEVPSSFEESHFLNQLAISLYKKKKIKKSAKYLLLISQTISKFRLLLFILIGVGACSSLTDKPYSFQVKFHVFNPLPWD